MKLSRPPVLTVDKNDANDFEHECEKLIKDNYRMHSSSCGFINSERHNFDASYQAVFMDITIK